MPHLNAFQLVRPRGIDIDAVPLRPNGLGRPVDQLSSDGVLIHSWPTLMAAAREILPTNPRAVVGGISNCVRGVSRTAHGFMWRSAKVYPK